MRLKLSAASFAVVSALILNSEVALAKSDKKPENSGPAVAVFTSSTAASLSANKRVAIAEVVISFQTSTGQTISTASLGKDVAKYGLGGLLKHDKTSETGFMRLELDPVVAQTVANNVYKKLQEDLIAIGFEVVPEAEVTAAASYQALLKESGFSNPSKYYNSQGDVLLAGPDALKPYMPYAIELGDFYENGKVTTYIPGWVKQVPFNGGSSTEGGPKFSLGVGAWKVPDLETKLAKELNAHVLKANFVLTLGKLDLSVAHDYSVEGDQYQGTNSTTTTETTSGTASAGLGVQEWQSRIAFRTADGKSQKPGKNDKGQSAKDGDVVVTIDKPVAAISNFFSLANGKELEAVVSITDAALFSKVAVNLIATEQKKMLDLVKP
ncbi:hypothetical protein [Cellvibrio sp.]|uniref:hypothetical protein n=1 Tax=Cellvibrio sp. TaxID=1965322 RepID=UPI00396478AB